MSIQSGFTLPMLDENGKQIVVPFPALEGFKTWFTGAGDQLSPVARGKGPKLRLSFTGPETKSITIQFTEPVEVHDGQGIVRPAASWGLDDTAEVCIEIPATSASVNGTTTGNCNLVDTGNGFNIIVPAAGDGGHDVTLADVVPVINRYTTGYWDVDLKTGAVTAAASPGKGNCDLYDTNFSGFVMRSIPIGNEKGVLDIDVYKTEWVHPKWSIKVTVDKQSIGSGEFAAWLLCFREHNTET